MRIWLNFLGYQLAWLACVMGAARELAWPGVVVSLAFVAFQWWASPWRRADLQLAISCTALGLLMDGGLAHYGLIEYAASSTILPAPAWILALWAAFGMTLNHSLAFLKPSSAAFLGALGGPLAYLAGARMGAIDLPWPGVAIVVLALAWAASAALLVALAHQWRSTHGASCPARGAT